MKIKKQLQKANKEINEKIIEDGYDLYKTLIDENFFEKQEVVQSSKKSRKLVLAFLLSSAFIFVIALSLILSFSLMNTDQYIQYIDSNNVTIDCNLNEINNADSQININTNQFTYSCHKTYDKVSGDTLYYSLKLIHKEDLLEAQISIVNNKNYSFEEYYNNEKNTGTYKGYTMTYSVKLNESDMLPMNQFFGCLEIGETKVYFDFFGVASVHTTPNLFLDEVLIIQ